MAQGAPGDHNIYGSTTISDAASAVLGNHYGDSYQIFLVSETYDQSLDLSAKTKKQLSLPVCKLTKNNQHWYRDDDKQEGEQDTHQGGVTELATVVERIGPPPKDLDPARQRLLAWITKFTKSAEIRKKISMNGARNHAKLVPDTIDQVSHSRFSSAHSEPIGGHSSTLIASKRTSEYGEAYAAISLVLAILTYRNLSLDMLWHAVKQVKSDPLAPYLGVVIACWLTNYLTRVTLEESPTAGPGNSIWLEDAYKGRSLVSLQIFESHDLLHAFLRTRFKDYSIWNLIDAGSYNLMIGHRFAPIVSVEQACSGRLKPSDVLVMSIRYRASSAQCLECLNKLKAGPSCSFACSYCRRSYSVPLRQLETFSRLNTALFLLPSWQASKSSHWDNALGGLQHVDLEVPPRSHPHVLGALNHQLPGIHAQPLPQDTKTLVKKIADRVTSCLEQSGYVARIASNVSRAILLHVRDQPQYAQSTRQESAESIAAYIKQMQDPPWLKISTGCLQVPHWQPTAKSIPDDCGLPPPGIYGYVVQSQLKSVQWERARSNEDRLQARQRDRRLYDRKHKLLRDKHSQKYGAGVPTRNRSNPD